MQSPAMAVARRAKEERRVKILAVFFIVIAVLVLIVLPILGAFLAGLNGRIVHRRRLTKACSHAPEPSACLSGLSEAVPPPRFRQKAVSVRQILESSINHSIFLLADVREKLPILRDCNQLVDLHYELLEAASSDSMSHTKTLLTAAMTNGNSCLEDLKEMSSAGAMEILAKEFAPVSGMISHSLAIIKYIDTLNAERRSPLPMHDFSFGFGTPSHILADAVVAKDGSGDFRSIGEAIDSSPSFSTERYVIKIRSGVYEETVHIHRNKSNLVLVGDGMQSTVIASTLSVDGDRFLARDLTILNRAGPEKRHAVALRAASTSAFFRCNITSYQGTLYAHSFRQLYTECVIQGTVDFIFGNAAAVFQNCLILPRKPLRRQKSVITAQGRDDPNQNSGFLMHNCTIAAAPDLGDSGTFRTFLGRPLRNHSRTVIMHSYIGKVVHPQGWCKLNKYSRVDSVEYVEYNNYGPGSDTERRVKWRGVKRNCSLEELRDFGYLHPDM